MEVKVAVIEKKGQEKIGNRALAKELNCRKTQIDSILAKKEDIGKEYEEFRSSSRKRRKYSTPNDDINDIYELTLERLTKARNKNIISGPILQSKARVFAEAIGNTEFVASNGWLEKFTKRNNNGFNVLSSEAADVSTEIVTDWKKRLNDLCKDYSAEDIFNCDETGLFWREIPSKSLTFKDEKCSKGKQSKERITLLI